MSRQALRLFAFLLGLACSALNAQSAGAEQKAAIVRYLEEVDDAKATQHLKACLALPDPTGQATLETLMGSPEFAGGSLELRMPYRDQALVISVQAPVDHHHKSKPLPLIFDISGGSTAAHLPLDRVIRASVPNYTPPEFSDEGRDAFLKAARTAAHAACGDVDRLWLTGFSWAGHASYDTALHRPGAVRGIIPTGGGPRHVHFRLLPNLRATATYAFVGAKDDPILVWNLKEVDRVKGEWKLPHVLNIDPDAGHTLPLRGLDGAAGEVLTLTAHDATFPMTGSVVADGVLVENELLRIDDVDLARVTPPERVPVSSTLDIEAQRRAKLKALSKYVVKCSWKLVVAKTGAKTLTLDADGVRAVTVYFRAPWFTPGDVVTIKSKSKIVWSGTLALDRSVLLTDARRTGHRYHLALQAVAVRF